MYHQHHQNALLKNQLTNRSRKHLIKVKVIVLKLADIGKR